MLLDRLLQNPERWLPARMRALLGLPQAQVIPPSPGARTMRLAYLSHARERAGNRRTRPFPELVPVPLADGVDLFVPAALPGSGIPLDLIVHLRGGTPDAFAQLSSPALIVRADAPGLSGALLKRFGQRDWLRQTTEAVQQACWQEWRWLPVMNRTVLSSFGAGYAPLAAALAQERIVARTDAVFILDGIHYGRPGQIDSPALEPFLNFARLAASGEKLMVITHTSIAPGFASSTDAASYLIRSVKARRIKLDRDLADDWTPYYRACKGGFQVEGYPGREARSHIAQIQQIGRIWDSYLHLAQRSAGQFPA
ncbi:MAG: hypothetical protein ACAI44_10205 [Candidatus Sericytochromatia bacterium]